MSPVDRTLRQRFGTALLEARQAASLSQEELAERSDLSRVFISELERGLKSPTLDAIEALSAALGMKPHELVRAADDAGHS